ncbi:MAG TPA: CPBP family glutamic-type intramembrane protease [Nitrososphaerales archaeon]|nr:CPBP family glutamic-type intramembrane protease [Nitrososphaerales archaeon]
MQHIELRRETHWVAVLYAIVLVLLAVLLFVTFGLGAYYVYNSPVSNVVATTYAGNSQNAFVEVRATGLSGASQRQIWIDPQVNYDANGNPQSFIPSSGIFIANTNSDPNGNVAGNFSISNANLKLISNNGKSVHSLWVVGFSGQNQNFSVSTSSPISITADSEKNYSASTQLTGLTFFVTLATFVVPINSDLGTLFIVLWTIYVLLFAMALNGPLQSLVRAIKHSASVGISGVFGNSMLAVMAIFPIVIWVSVIMALLQQSVGVSTGNLPPTDPLLLYVELSIAPIREELGFRVIPIGLATLVILLTKGRVRDGLLSLWHPSRYLKKNDSPKEYRRHLWTVYVMIAISSFLFGLAHYVLGAGWGPGKIAEAATAGIALAALYYKYGLPAAILLHWAVDYGLSTYTLSPSLTGAGDFVTLYTLPIAAASSVALIILLLRITRERNSTPVFITGGSGSSNIP